MQTALVPVMEINNLTRLDKLFIRCSEPCEVCQLREIDVVVVSRAVTTIVRNSATVPLHCMARTAAEGSTDTCSYFVN